MLKLKFRIREFIRNDHKGAGIILAVFLVMVLFFVRYDYSYFLYRYHVRPGDSLWSVLSNEVFSSSEIAEKSMDYLKSQRPGFDFEYIQGNTSRFGWDGDIVNVSNGRISIITPGDEYRLEPTSLMHQTSILNHNLQLLYHDIFVIAIFIILSILVVKRKELKLRVFLKNSYLFFFYGFIFASVVRLFIRYLAI
ncbi:MAG: hypothetical protein ABIH78_00600 [Candidatus Peregrinibacteria bacterium]